MRVKNLFIIVAIIAAVWLVIRYFYQVRNLRRGYNRVSGGRVFLNWFLAIVLVVSLVGVGMTSFAAHRTEGVTPSKTSTKSVSPAKSNSDNDNDEVVLKFKKSARLDENEEARVKFLISPQTKVVIGGTAVAKSLRLSSPAREAGRSRVRLPLMLPVTMTSPPNVGNTRLSST